MSADDTITALAAEQHGLVTRAQLLAEGVPLHIVKHRLRKGRLCRVHRGVYRVGPVSVPRAHELAAVLACGAGAVVSHRSALVLLELLAPGAAGSPEDVTVVGCDRGRRPGIRVHRVHRLDPDDVMTVDGVPVTTAARSLIDFAGAARPRELEQALAQSERRQLVSAAALLDRIARQPRRRGMSRLRALLTSDTEPALARSELEERFLALVREARLPAPQTNVDIGGFELDFLWKEAGLAVELDGYAFHSSARSFEGDRLRDGVLMAQGIRVFRITWRRLEREPLPTLVRVAQALVQGT